MVNTKNAMSSRSFWVHLPYSIKHCFSLSLSLRSQISNQLSRFFFFDCVCIINWRECLKRFKEKRRKSQPYHLLWSRKMITLMGAARMHKHSNTHICHRLTVTLTARTVILPGGGVCAAIWQQDKYFQFGNEYFSFFCVEEKERNERRRRWRWKRRKWRKKVILFFLVENGIDFILFFIHFVRLSVISTISTYARMGLPVNKGHDRFSDYIRILRRMERKKYSQKTVAKTLYRITQNH